MCRYGFLKPKNIRKGIIHNEKLFNSIYDDFNSNKLAFKEIDDTVSLYDISEKISKQTGDNQLCHQCISKLILKLGYSLCFTMKQGICCKLDIQKQL